MDNARLQSDDRAMKEFLPLLPALIHLYIFVLESLLWKRPRTRKIFGLRSDEEVQHTRLLAFNQGFYNLFLAVAILLGLHLRTGSMTHSAGTVLVAYALISIIGAGAVLFLSNPRLWRGALLQSLPAIVALIPIAA